MSYRGFLVLTLAAASAVCDLKTGKIGNALVVAGWVAGVLAALSSAVACGASSPAAVPEGLFPGGGILPAPHRELLSSAGGAMLPSVRELLSSAGGAIFPLIRELLSFAGGAALPLRPRPPPRQPGGRW